jgi:nucleotide-binding universal stress UspA family protein
VIVALDVRQPDTAARVLHRASALGFAPGASVVLLHVIRPEASACERMQAVARLAACEAHLRVSRVDARSEVIYAAHPATGIAEAAEQQDAFSVVLGSRTRTGTCQLAYGRTVLSLAECARRPLLLVPHRLLVP